MGFDIGGALSGGATGFLVGGPVGGLIGAGLGGLAGGQANDQRDAAAAAAAAATEKGIAEQRRQYDLTRSDLMPFLFGGLQAQGQLSDILGGRANIENDPLMQQQLALSNKAAGRYASAGGSLGTGAFQKNLLRGTADVFNNRINQLLALRSGGQSAGGQLGAFGQNAAANISQGYQNIGNVQAGAALGKANTIDSLLGMAGGYGMSKLMGGM